MRKIRVTYKGSSRPGASLRLTWVAVLLVILATAPQPAGPDTPVPPPETPLVIGECVLPNLEGDSDFYSVNPTLRDNYYTYLEKTLFPNRERELEYYRDNTDFFIFRARFRVTLKDFFIVNARLVEAARTIQRHWAMAPDDSARIPLKDQFEIIEKSCRKLSGSLAVLTPDLEGGSFDARKTRQLFNELARRGMFHTMVPNLLLKVDALQERLCQLFFPASHTISLDELGSRSSPGEDLEELRELAKAIYLRMPARGFPKPAPERHP